MALEDHLIHLENGRLAADTPAEAVARLVRQGVAEAGGGGIVVHFHGGLVNLASGLGIAQRLLPVYRDAGAYPLFVAWESGLVGTLRNNLGEIARETLFRLVWKRVARIVLRKLGQTPAHRAASALPAVDAGGVEEALDAALDRGESEALREIAPAVPETIGELTPVERLALENELLADAELAREIQLVSGGLRDPAQVEEDRTTRGARVQASTRTLMDPAVLEGLVERPAPGARGILSAAGLVQAVVAVAAGVVSRYARGRDHGFHATLVEEILRALYLANVGGVIWRAIKGDTADAFGADPAVFGGTALLAELARAIDPAAPPRLTLVGESAGALFAAELLAAAEEGLPGALRTDLILLAPAATFERTAPVVERHRERIGGFRMFTMADCYERGDRLVPVLYPHSLLYFISGVLEAEADAPIVGMERFYDPVRYPGGDFPAVRTVRDFVGERDDRAVWSVADLADPGRRSTAVEHDAFDEDPATLESMAAILRSGF